MSQSSLVNTPRDSSSLEKRRSTRIDKSVPLIVLGQNRMGEPFMERTTSVSLNMHGCRYPSRHDCSVGSWVTLQVVALNDPHQKPAEVRAMVRSAHAPSSLHELHQVGVEFETPANVWGIAAPPADWQASAETNTSRSAASAKAPSVQTVKTSGASGSETPTKSQPKLSKVATFPSTTTASSQAPAPKEAEAAKPQRIVVSPEGLLASLQGRLQQEAEKAVQAAVAKQAKEAATEALKTIEDARQRSVKQVQDFVAKQAEALSAPPQETSVAVPLAEWEGRIRGYRSQLEETARGLDRKTAELRRELANAQQYVEKMKEVSPRIQAYLDDVIARAKSTFDEAAAQVVDRRHELLLEGVQTTTQEALLKLDTRAEEIQSLVQNAVNSALQAFRSQAERHMNVALGDCKERTASALSSLEAESRASYDARRRASEEELTQRMNMALCECKERTISALSSLEAESRASVDARRRALEQECAHSAEQSMEQFRTGMKAFLHSCLLAAVNAVDEHSKATLEGLLQDKGKTLRGALGESQTHREAEPPPEADSNHSDR